MKKALFILIIAGFSGLACAADPVNIVEQRGAGKVRLVKYENGAWQLLVDNKPYLIQGVEYSVDPVGKTPKESNEWMNDDLNNNTRPDGPYDSWVDRNGDNYQDADEPTVGDFQLLKDMGCNTIRIYHPCNINKEVLRDLYDRYGIRVIMGNFIGAYCIGSGADWSCGTDYTDERQRACMKQEIEKMVLEHRNEPYLLMWMLGNENDIEGSYDNSTFNNTNASREPRKYAEFVGELAAMIKKLDPDHPVGVCNAYYKLVPYYAQYAQDIDVIGMNAYSGPYGFGLLWGRIKSSFDRPVLITEYGTDSYHVKKKVVDEAFQAQYHRRAWNDIVDNSCRGNKAGNALGGVVYCWTDKWWLSGSPKEHDAEIGCRPGPVNDGMFTDEWFGICGQGNGIRSPFIRQLRAVYNLYRDELWNGKPEAESKTSSLKTVPSAQ